MDRLRAISRAAAALWIWIWIWTGLLVWAPPLLADGSGDRFYFVQISDTHLGIKENDLRTRKVVAAVNALPMEIRCVVHTGDIYDRRVRDSKDTAARAADIFKALRVPVYFLPGNNEIDLFRRTDRLREAYTKTFSPLIYSRKVAGTFFVFTYTDPLREGYTMPGFDPFEAVRQELEKAGNRPVLLFHHCPSVRDFYNNEFHPGWAAEIREKWLALVNGNNIKAVIAGHFHRDEFHWLGKVPLYVAGPVAEKYGRQSGFRIYEYKGGRLSYTTQYLE